MKPCPFRRHPRSNDYPITFTDKTRDSGMFSAIDGMMGHGAAWDDFDGDGRIDLFLVNWFSGNHSRLLHNESPAKNWLNVQVRGRTINRMGIGPKVVVRETGTSERPDQLLGYQEIATGYGYASGQPCVVALHIAASER